MNQKELIEHLTKTAESNGAFHVQVFVDRQVSWSKGFRTDEPDEIVTIKFRRYKDELKPRK